MNIFLIVLASFMGLNMLLSIIKLIATGQTSVKVVVLDVLTTIITAVLLFLAFLLKQEFLLDIALIYAILAFAAVLVVARYMEKGV